MVNCYPILPCDNCNSTIQAFIDTYNSNIIQTFSFTTTVGAKVAQPFGSGQVTRVVSGGSSGSLCITYSNGTAGIYGYMEGSYYPW